MAKKNGFMKQLASLKDEFMKYAEDNSAKVNKDTFEVEICKYYLLFRVEAEDEYENTMVFRQEIETDRDDEAIYQKPLFANDILIER